MSFLVVGAGLFGAVCARELTDAGHRVLVVEKRSHIGGNCFSRYHTEAGCHQHVYGAHIFHTNSSEVWAYVRRFAEFNSYVHRLHVNSRGSIYSFPINLFTLHQVFGVTTPAEAEARLAEARLPVANPESLEQWCLGQIGRELYETFIRGYTCKQWRRDPRDLPASIIRRLPVRLTFDDRYYEDRFQGIPVGGYTGMFERLLAGIPVELGVDFLADRDGWQRRFDHVIYSGPIDAFFGYSEGVLGYRSLRFDDQVLDVRDAQGIAVMNYADETVPYTRTIEHKHFDMALTHPRTVVTTEHPEDWQPGMVEYYPVNTDVNQNLYRRYRALADRSQPRVTFGGRLGEYRYYDMHQVVAAALATVRRLPQA
jgi:UDP-galactopyranose mutase